MPFVSFLACRVKVTRTSLSVKETEGMFHSLTAKILGLFKSETTTTANLKEEKTALQKWNSFFFYLEP